MVIFCLVVTPGERDFQMYLPLYLEVVCFCYLTLRDRIVSILAQDKDIAGFCFALGTSWPR